MENVNYCHQHDINTNRGETYFYVDGFNHEAAHTILLPIYHTIKKLASDMEDMKKMRLRMRYYDSQMKHANRNDPFSYQRWEVKLSGLPLEMRSNIVALVNDALTNYSIDHE